MLLLLQRLWWLWLLWRCHVNKRTRTRCEAIFACLQMARCQADGMFEALLLFSIG